MLDSSACKKILQQVLEDSRELAVIQERVATLFPEDEETLRKLHSLDDLPETWKEGVLLSNSVEAPSRVRAGVEPPGAVHNFRGIERQGDGFRETW